MSKDINFFNENNYKRIIELRNGSEILTPYDKMLFNHYNRQKNYYKNELGLYVKFCSKWNKTTGDIDHIEWDYEKKILRFFEEKNWSDKSKVSQDKLYKFLGNIQILGYDVSSYQLRGIPPYRKSELYSYNEDRIVKPTPYELNQFINMNINFKDL